ncbi:MAG: hypothetical protein AB8B55_10150 [Mariniblastus sp.]
MSRLTLSILVVGISVSAICLSSCSRPVETVVVREPVPIVSDSLEFGQVLMESQLKMFTSFADVNADAKLDLLLGTTEWSRDYKSNQDFSIHLGKPADNSIAFESPYWPKSNVADTVIPSG